MGSLARKGRGGAAGTGGEADAREESHESSGGGSVSNTNPSNRLATQDLHQQLDKIYNDASDAGAFGGAERLFRRAKELKIPGVTRAKVRVFLASVPSYTLHRMARKKFQRNPIYAHGVDEQWQADLVDMQALSRANAGIKYLLTCIDVFSKYAWVVPLHAKSAKEMVNGFTKLFQESEPRRPRKLQTDRGKEFFNVALQALFRDKFKIKHFASWSDQKAAIVERFNRTLKERMWRYFSARQTHHYLDILPRLVEAYNATWHRSIGMAPAQVRPTKQHQKQIHERLYPSTSPDSQSIGQDKVAPQGSQPLPPLPPPPPDEKQMSVERPNTMVRISRVKGDFEKGYKPNWSEEDFRIRDVIDRPGITRGRRVYKLEDKMGEPIQGMWYPEELQAITKNRYLIEKILRKRAHPDTGITELLVQWQGWPKKFNSWITEEEYKRQA